MSLSPPATPMPCPDPASLLRLVRAELSREDSTLLERHIDTCPACQQALQKLVGSLPQALRPSAHDPSRTRDFMPEEQAQARRPDLPGAPAVPGYTIVAELGRGGMGVVYKARQQRPSRTVALKMILAGSHAPAHMVQRFVQEAEAVAQLQHPNIVQLFEAGQHGELPYFTLEFVSGGNLAHQLRGKPLAPAEAAQLLEPLAQAMDYAHQRGIVHRDLKPANILLASSEPVADDTAHHSPLTTHSPKISDFGLAKRLESNEGMTETGAAMGSPPYMAPEQASGETKRVGPAADVYALGAILYECLTGRPPFQGPTALETMRQVQTEEPVPPSRLQRTVPRDLETICLKCLAKEPHRRYASARALSDDLGRFRRGEPIVARPVGWVERAVKWCQRRPAVAGLSAAVVVVLLGGLASTTVMWLQARANYQRSEQNFDNTVAAVNKYFQGVSLRLRGLPGAEPMRQELMVLARPFYEDFVKQRQDDARLEHELARAIATLAEIEADTGSPAKAQALWQDANARLRLIHAQNPGDSDARAALAKSLLQSSKALRLSGRMREASDELTAAAAHYGVLAAGAPAAFAGQEALCWLELAEVKASLGNPSEALALMRKGVQRATEHAELLPQVPFVQMRRAHAHACLGQMLLAFRQPPSARDELEKARDILVPLAEQPIADQPVARYDLARALGILGRVYDDLGLGDDAEKAMLAAQELLDQFVRDAPTVKDYRHNRAVNQHNLSSFYAGVNRFEDSERWCRAALQERAKLHAEYPGEPALAFELAVSYRHMVHLAARTKNADERLHWSGKAIELLRTLVKQQPAHAPARDSLANAAGGRGEFLCRQGQWAEALLDLDLAVAHAEGALQERLRASRAVCRARTGDRAGALADCAAVPAPRDFGDAYVLLLAQALCYAEAKTDAALSDDEREQKADGLAQAALRRLEHMKTLEPARAGLRQKLQEDPEMQPLMSRPEVQAFLRGL